MIRRCFPRHRAVEFRKFLDTVEANMPAPCGGAKYLASLAGPLPDLIFCPTGGIDAQKAGNYFALANVACVGGSWMVAPRLIAAQDFAKVEQLARKACALGGRL